MTPASRTFTPNGLNQYAKINGVTHGYDQRGNLTSDPNWAWGYDVDNQLITAKSTGLALNVDAELGYDPTGRLATLKEKLGTDPTGTTTSFLYDGTDLVAEYDNAGNLLRRYVHGPGVDEPLVAYTGSGTSNKEWLYADHLGSVVASANTGSASVAIYRYGPFGEPNESGGARFRYTGQMYLHNLSLYHYKARVYSPTIGRFLQADPVGMVDDVNLYSYVKNNPISLNDPSGMTAAEARALAGKLSDAASNVQFNHIYGVLDNYILGGYGGAFERSYYSGNYGAALGNLVAAVGFWYGNAVTMGDGTLAAATLGAVRRTGGETAATAYGRQAHINYGATQGANPAIVINQQIPGGSGLRPDAIDYANNIVRELKPDSSSGIRARVRQLKKYVAELERVTGQAWQGALDLYRRPKGP